MRPEIVIRGGTLVDGTGAAPRRADVALDGGQIVDVGEQLDRGRREIDADGCIVTPGFVDLHTHYDGQATWDPLLAPSCQHGVTSVLMGNCGVGFAPVADDRHEWLVEMMEGVEDIPGTALHEGLQWDWESFPEYLDSLDRRERAIDVGAQVPHSALRGYVMGDRGADPAEHPDGAERERMAELLDAALESGALGVSTSRTEVHRTKSGQSLGTLRAGREEILALAGVLGERGGGVFQFISDCYRSHDEDFVQDELELLGEIARASRGPVSFTIQQSHDAPERWRDLLGAATRLRAEGLDVSGQAASRPIGLLLGLQATTNPFTPCREYARVAHLPLEERVMALRDGELRRRILATHKALTSGPKALPGLAFFGRFEDMYVLDDPVDYSLGRATSVAAIAKSKGTEGADEAYDALLANGGRQLLYAPVFNFAHRDLEAIREMIASPATIFGLSDAGAHCGTICDASMTTSYLTMWGRDETDGGLGLASVIRELTRRPAEHIGWRDRGVVAPGFLADCNVIDIERLACSPPRIAYDLPAGGRRLLQSATGYRYTVKRGVVTFVDGEHSGELPGHLMRARREASPFR